MPAFEDTIWLTLEGGYRSRYDPRNALSRLDSPNRRQALDELYENLYHQGDVGVASYASVPILIGARALDLAGAIEAGRLNPHNPPLPDWLEPEYVRALHSALEQSPTAEADLIGFYVIHASINGSPRLAIALNLMSPSEIIAEYGPDA